MACQKVQELSDTLHQGQVLWDLGVIGQQVVAWPGWYFRYSLLL